MTDHSTYERPLSPHLTIYKPQISSVLSILHRLTGVVLFLGILLLVWWIILSVYTSFSPDMLLWNFFGSLTGKIILCAWTAALFYHFLNGIKYLFWGAGIGFEIRSVQRAGLAVLIGTVALTALSWYLAFYK